VARPGEQALTVVTNGDLLALIEQAWALISAAGGGDWEREGPAWHRDAAAWRDTYHHLLDQMKSSRQAIEREITHTLGHHRWEPASHAVTRLMELIDAYAGEFPAHYVISDPDAPGD